MIPLLSAPLLGSLMFVSLSPRIFGFLVHWDPMAGGEGKGLTVPCLGNQSVCVWCVRRQLPKWKGYIAAQRSRTRQLIGVEITAGAYRNCPELHALQGKLRGVGLEIGRLKHFKRNDPAYVRVHPGAYDGELLAAFDVPAFLQRLWGYDVRVFRCYDSPPADATALDGQPPME